MSDDKATDEKLDDILHPSTKAKEFRITLVFGYKTSPDYARAVDLAKRNPAYTEEGSGEWVRHSATYAPAEVDELFALFNLVHEWGRPKFSSTGEFLRPSLWLPQCGFTAIR
jgi:hypothetical protein